MLKNIVKNLRRAYGIWDSLGIFLVYFKYILGYFGIFSDFLPPALLGGEGGCQYIQSGGILGR